MMGSIATRDVWISNKTDTSNEPSEACPTTVKLLKEPNRAKHGGFLFFF